MGAPEGEKNYCLTVHLTALCDVLAFLTFVGAKWQKYLTGKSMADNKIKPHHRGCASNCFCKKETQIDHPD